jgi:hypothetical protein
VPGNQARIRDRANAREVENKHRHHMRQQLKTQPTLRAIRSAPDLATLALGTTLMPFVKLDCGILHSTLWADVDSSRVFITALLMAKPFETTEPLPQYEVDSLKKTGFVVPKGWYGFIESAGPGIVKASGLDQEAGMAALRRLGEPEPTSRTPDWEGRRLVRVSGGYIALNYLKYRDKDSTTALRQQRFRERNRQRSNAVTVTPVTQAEAEADNISLPTLSKTPAPASKPNEENEERVEHAKTTEENDQETAPAGWKTWRDAFKTTSPRSEHTTANLATLETLHEAWGYAGLSTAASAFRRDCDSGRIKVASLSTFLKCQKNYAPKIPAKQPTAHQREQDLIAQGTKILTDRRDSPTVIDAAAFWNTCSDFDFDYFARWYQFLAERKVFLPGIMSPPPYTVENGKAVRHKPLTNSSLST